MAFLKTTSPKWNCFFLSVYFLSFVSTAPIPGLILPKILHLNALESVVAFSSAHQDLPHAQKLLIEIRDASLQNELLFSYPFLLDTGAVKRFNIKITKYPKFGKAIAILIDQETQNTTTRTIEIRKSNGISVIQLDKPIYTPNQQVKIRMLRLDKDLKPIQDDFRLQILNPQNIIMESVQFSKKDALDYFVDHTFQIPPAPINGLWKAVLYQDDELRFNSSFEIREYVLPPFLITLNTTSFILPTTKNIEGLCKASYTFGAPLQGTVIFKFGIQRKASNKIFFIGRTNYKSLVDGKAGFSFNTKILLNYSDHSVFVNNDRFVVEAEVSDGTTGIKLKQITDESIFTNEAYLISFKDAPNDFKPDLPTDFSVTILDPNEKPAPYVPVLILIPELQMKKDVISNNEGIVSFSLVAPIELQKVTIRVQTVDSVYQKNEQGFGAHILYRYNFQGLPYPSIEGINKTYKVGEQAIAKITINGPLKLISSIYCFSVASNGKILSGSRLASLETFSVPVTPEMYPVATLLCIVQARMVNSSPQNSLTVDSKRIRVEDDNMDCGLDMRFFGMPYKISEKSVVGDFEPGAEAILNVRNGQGQYLSLIGIDEAVFGLIKKGITKQQFIDDAKQSLNTICGAGGGLNVGDVLLNSGLVILGSQSDSQLFIGSHCQYNYEAPNHPVLANNTAGTRLKRTIFDFDKQSHIYSKKKLFKRHLFGRSMQNTSEIKMQELHFNDSPGFIERLDKMDNKNKKCCLLAKMQKKLLEHLDCITSSQVLRKYLKNDTECIESYLDCCHSLAPTLGRYQEKNITNMSIRASINTNSKKKDDFIHVAYYEDYEFQAKIRRDFRETWLFELVKLDKQEKNVTFNLPDTISIQSMSVVVLSEERGLCIYNRNPIRLRVFKPLFVKVSLPYKAVQNEQLEMVINVFNYFRHSVSLLLYYYGVDGVCSEAQPGEKSERQKFIIEPQQSASVGIPLIPLRTGSFPIKIVAISPFGSDVVIKILQVVPQGISIADDYSFQLDPKNRQKRRKRLILTKTFSDRIDPDHNLQLTKVKLTPNQMQQLIVPNSEHCVISAIADEFGPALKYAISESDNLIDTGSADTNRASLDHLIRKPRGCGEQTAFYYGPTLYTLKYLQHTNKLTHLQHEKANSYLQAGYKRQLMFRKNDGSFSAFPNRPSSTWLTAYLVKLFCQSDKYVKIDPKVINSALFYLINQQNSSGYWSERYPVLHKQLIGGIKGRTQLTAYVLSSLRECANLEPVAVELNGPLQASLDRAEQYLLTCMQDLLKSTSAYSMALVSYAFLDSKSQETVSIQLLNRLADLAIIGKDQHTIAWNDEFPIEVASYVLLTVAGLQKQQLNSEISSEKKLTMIEPQDARLQKYLMYLKEQSEERQKLIRFQLSRLLMKLDSQGLVNFLTSQRTFTGGFDSTQDTILALNALAEHFQNQMNKEQMEMLLSCNITSKANRYKRSLTFNKENALVMRKLELGKKELNNLLGEELEFLTTGNGYGVVSVKLMYNVIAPEKLCKFDIEIELSDWRDGKPFIKKYVPSYNFSEDTQDEKNDEITKNEEEGIFDEFPDELLVELNLKDKRKKRTRRKVKTDFKSANEIDQNYLKNLNHVSLEKDFINDNNQTKRFYESDWKIDNSSVWGFGVEHNDEIDIIPFKIVNTSSISDQEAVFKELLKISDDFENTILDEIDDFIMKKELFDVKQNIWETSEKPFKRNKRSTNLKKNKRYTRSIRLASESPDNMNLFPEVEENYKTSDTQLHSKSVYKLRICTQHIPQYDSEMTIIEVGLLTGFTVNKQELDRLVGNGHESNSAGTLIAKYELTPRSVIFYLDSVPFARRICFEMKLTQQIKISNVQAGIVKVYDYYKKDDVCTSLYSPNRVIESLNITCDNVACNCAVDNNCPSEKRLMEFGKIAEMEMSRAKTKLHSMICDQNRFDQVFLGQIINKKILNGFILLRVKVTNNLKINAKLEEILVLTMNQECYSRLSLVTLADEYLFFINAAQQFSTVGQPNDSEETVANYFLDRSSIIFNMAPDLLRHSLERKVLRDLIQNVLHLKQRLLWRC